MGKEQSRQEDKKDQVAEEQLKYEVKL